MIWTPGMIPTVMRLNLNRRLNKIFPKIKKGVVLDIGSEIAPYKSKIAYTKYMTMDINPANKPDIISDIHDIKWKSDYFDTVIATEVLEHLIDPKLAVKEMHRVLKKGGTCVITTRFAYNYHPNPKDYYRFSQDSLKDIFKDFKDVKIISHGNRLHLIWHILNRGIFRVVLNIFNPLFALIDFKDDVFPLGFIVVAKK